MSLEGKVGLFAVYIFYDILNNLSCVDLFYDKKARQNIQRKFKKPARPSG
jgi:hypothetical protein